MKTLKDYFPDSLNGSGLFSAIANIEWFPGLSQSDFDTYFYLRVGEKIGKENILDLYTDSTGKVTGDKLQALAKLIYSINIVNWRNIYRDMTAEYNPIENTDFTETIKDKTDSTGKVESESSSNASNDRYGFNSSTSVHDTKGDTSAESSTDSETHGTYEREYRKHGNIGVQTAGEIITKDLPIWLTNRIADHFISDICDLIALSIY